MKTYLDNPVIDEFVLSYMPLTAILVYLLATKLFLIVVKVSVKKNIIVRLENRSSHTGWCTNLGGVVIYSVLILSTSFFGALTQSGFNFRLFRSFFAAITILFFIGLKDDLILMSKRNKILGQFIAFSIVIFLTDTRLHSLEGIFGVHQLSYFGSLILSYFAFFFMVNSYNLSDGIDGLAGSISLLSNLALGCYFYFHHQLGQSVIAFTLVGILFAFLKYNFSDRFKVIMGDSGSMVLGFIMAFQFLHYLSFNSSLHKDTAIDISILYLFVLFSYPIVDTTRIFFVRMKQGKNPFVADKNHLHHALIAKGLSHRQATQLIVLVTLLLLAFAYGLSGLNVNLSLVLLIVIAYLLYFMVALYRLPALFFLKQSSDL